MKYLITFALLTLCLSSKAQKDASFLIGSWKVIDAYVPESTNARQKQALNIVRANLLKTLFKFDNDGNGKFKFPMNNVPIDKTIIPSEDISWTYSAAKQYVEITERSKPKELIAQLHVKVENGNTYFIIGETSVKLKVVKY